MSTQTLKNTHRAIYLNVGSGSTETYERLGNGVSSFTPSTNPTVDTKHYIDASAPTHSITATERQYAFTADLLKGDPCLDYLAGLDGKTGDDVKTKMVDVDLTDNSARLYDVVIAIDQPYSIEGGENQQMTGTFYTNGDVVEGTFDTSTKKFTPTSA